MDDEQVDAQLEGLIHHRLHGVHRQQGRPDLLPRIPAHQTDGIPALGRGGRVDVIQQGPDIAQR